ncbi:hypothetical protein [Parafilimonas sp.]|uniref:hypothetical protein n=1 Tax=Parafilimonas sp. TaxID=1969739 RepID=UPI0039E3A6A7
MAKEYFTAYSPKEITDMLAEAIRSDEVRDIIAKKLKRAMAEVYLKPSEVCQLFQPSISRQTLSRLVKDGLIPKTVLDGAAYFKLRDVKKAVKLYKKALR